MSLKQRKSLSETSGWVHAHSCEFFGHLWGQQGRGLGGASRVANQGAGAVKGPTRTPPQLTRENTAEIQPPSNGTNASSEEVQACVCVWGVGVAWGGHCCWV